MDGKQLSREDWIRAARLALLAGGIDRVRVERLTSELGVTKGSFYWHFKDVADLKEALISEWEQETALLRQALREPAGVQHLMATLGQRVVDSERGDIPSDASIFRWAAVDPVIATRVTLVEAERIALLEKLAASRETAQLFYMAYLGFILRRRHAADAEALFGMLSKFAAKTFRRRTKRTRARPQNLGRVR